jgi:hypothetical protein
MAAGTTRCGTTTSADPRARSGANAAALDLKKQAEDMIALEAAPKAATKAPPSRWL